MKPSITSSSTGSGSRSQRVPEAAAAVRDEVEHVALTQLHVRREHAEAPLFRPPRLRINRLGPPFVPPTTPGGVTSSRSPWIELTASPRMRQRRCEP